MPLKMQAVTIRQHGGPEVLKMEELPAPEPGPGEVRVAVRACAMNHLDIWVRRGIPGRTIPFPHIPGCDVAGVVHQRGPGAEEVAEGTPVIVSPGTSCGRCAQCLAGRDNLCRSYGILGEHRHGGYAQYVVVPAANLLAHPEAMPFTQAAALPLVFLTAWHMLVRKANVRAGETVLVQAGGSGVGSAAIQIAKLHGARVITTVGSDDKMAKAKALGADEVIQYRRQDFLEVVRALTDRRGVDVVFEHTGEATFAQSVLALTWGGRLVTCGATTGYMPKIDLRHVFFRQLTIFGSTMGSKADLFDVLGHVRTGKLRPVVDRIFPLHEAADAHRYVEDRAVFGKVVLQVG